MDKLIINFTPTGMIPTKAMTPHVPVSPEEIVDQVLEAARLGATMMHIHARDGNHDPTHKREIYESILSKIREKNREVVLCVSTSGRNFPGYAERSEVLDIRGPWKPDMASLTLSSLNFNNQESISSPQTIQALARKMLEAGIKPELEAFDAGMINYAKHLIKKGLLKPPYYFNLLIGNIACAQPNLIHVGLMIHELPEDSVWSLAGIGRCQHTMNSLAIVWGGGVRVGLEDNIWYDDARTRLASNLDLVQRVVDVAKAVGRPIATPAETRQALGLSP